MKSIETSDRKKPRLREMAALDKSRMLPLNYAFSYVLTPIYIVSALLLLIGIGAATGDGKVTAGLAGVILLAILTAVFLAGFPIVRKRAIRSERERYCFDTEAVGSRTEWDFSQEELSVRFNRYGMVADGKLHYYNHLKKFVYTTNEFKRVGIYLGFSDSGVLVSPAFTVNLTHKSPVLKVL